MTSTTRLFFAAITMMTVAACTAKSDAAPQATDAPAAAKAATDTLLARIDKSRIMGSDKATVWLVEASDFQCPFCKQFHEDTYKKILKDYVEPGKVRLGFVNHPMSFHQFAIPAAEAAMCAGAQDKFWQMHDVLFVSQERWTKGGDPQPVFDSLATSVGLNVGDWKSCVTSHRTLGMIQDDNRNTSRGGVEGTPSFFIANRLAVVGAEPYATFRKALDAALDSAAKRGGGDTPKK